MRELVAIVPTLGRPQALAILAERFAETTSSYRILFVCDPADVPTRRALEHLSDERPEVESLAHVGPYVSAVNAGIRATHEPLILVGADDIRPHPGWLEEAKRYLSDEIGYVSLNDLGNHDVMAGKYATLPLVARWYAVSEGDLYHPGYQHVGCDVDASLQAQARGAYAYAPGAVMEHLHPAWEKAPMDATYEAGGCNAEKWRADHDLLERRWPSWQQNFSGPVNDQEN